MMPSGLMKIEGVPDSTEVIPGMAFFANTGPEGKTCGDCAHRGYRRQSSRTRWDDVLQQEIQKSYRTQACAMFKAMTGRHGPAVSPDCKSCKYFEQKPKS